MNTINISLRKSLHTHILYIQVWSSTTQLTTTYGNILNKIKEFVINNIQIQKQELEYDEKKESYSILWKQIKLIAPLNSLFNSDIVTNTNYPDDIIYKHTENMLQEIEKKLIKENKMNPNDKIIFSIVKPINILF